MLNRAAVLCLAVLAACGTQDREPPHYQRVSLAELPGFAEAEFLPAVGAFLSTCPRLAERGSALASAKEWRDLCAEAAGVTGESAARAFFESRFDGLVVSGGEALVTGYYEPVFDAAPEPTEEFSAPVLSTPEELVMVDLGLFREELAGKRIAGKVEGGRLVPYADREGIEAAPPASSDVLGYMRPDDLFFLQIQGSGVLQFPDEARRIGYAAQNGHVYHAIGRTLVEEGHLPLEEVTMQSIREWLNDAPRDEAARVRSTNPSYVFFTDRGPAISGEGPLGSAGIPLTPRVSVAVDRTIFPLGTPLFIAGADESFVFRSLTVAQDTGGAIKGSGRADLFLGRGAEAGEIAGRLKLPATLTALVPRSSPIGREAGA